MDRLERPGKLKILGLIVFIGLVLSVISFNHVPTVSSETAGCPEVNFETMTNEDILAALKACPGPASASSSSGEPLASVPELPPFVFPVLAIGVVALVFTFKKRKRKSVQKREIFSALGRGIRNVFDLS